MFNAAILLIGILAGLVHLAVRRKSLDRAGKVELILLYCLVFGVGVVGANAFMMHVFFPERMAPMIGWEMSPFETEVGIHDGAWALLGFFAIWIRGGFWHAVVLGWSFFMIGAGIGHIKDTVVHGNYAPYNFSMIFFDIGQALLLIVLWIAWMRLRRNEKENYGF
ncbi:MAG: hypothetical protein K6T66_08660 [Peptococcaceae bacterium]|nr:hypothetical protein [Peptococcaceae bacterium]